MFVVAISDLIVACLRRYPTVWRTFILRYKTINLGIGGDWAEKALWRVNNMVLPISVRSIVIHCGTSNMDTSNADEMSLGIFPTARSISQRYPNIELSVSELLPRDIHWSTQWVKIKKTNNYLKDYHSKSVMCNHLVPPYWLCLCTPPQLNLCWYLILPPFHL